MKARWKQYFRSMDKLTQYNRRLLAIFGTMLLAAFGLGVIIALGIFIDSLIDSPSYDQGLQIRETTANGTDTTIFRTQQASFQEPVQLDTAKAQFVIPVGQVDLEEKERVTALASSGSFEYEPRKSRFDSYSGIFNNFIFYDYPSSTKTKIFSKKVAITNWSNAQVNGTELLLFMGTDTDSNKNKELDSDDYQSLFAFYLKDRKLVEYKLNRRSVLSYEPMDKTSLVSVQVGIDKNKDFKFDRFREPVEVVVLDVASRKLGDLVPPAMKAKIQSIIDK